MRTFIMLVLVLVGVVGCSFAQESDDSKYFPDSVLAVKTWDSLLPLGISAEFVIAPGYGKGVVNIWDEDGIAVDLVKKLESGQKVKQYYYIIVGLKPRKDVLFIKGRGNVVVETRACLLVKKPVSDEEYEVLRRKVDKIFDKLEELRNKGAPVA